MYVQYSTVLYSTSSFHKAVCLLFKKLTPIHIHQDFIFLLILSLTVLPALLLLVWSFIFTSVFSPFLYHYAFLFPFHFSDILCITHTPLSTFVLILVISLASLFTNPGSSCQIALARHEGPHSASCQRGRVHPQPHARWRRPQACWVWGEAPNSTIDDSLGNFVSVFAVLFHSCFYFLFAVLCYFDSGMLLSGVLFS